MVRSTKYTGPKKPHGSSRKSNALGYAKHQAQKSKTGTTSRNLSDIYEHQTEKVRRSTVKLQFEREELEGVGRGGFSGSDDEDEESRRGGPSRPRLVGGSDDEGGGIGEDEDEEIDSDGAFDESDEDRFAGFSFGKPKKSAKAKGKQKAAPRTVRFANIDLDEDEDGDDTTPKGRIREGSEEEEEGDSDEFIDVLDIMDGKGEPHSEDEATTGVEREGDQLKPSRNSKHAISRHISDDEKEPEHEDEDEESPDEGDSESDVAISEDEEDVTPNASALQDLESFITNLDTGKKRKAPDDDANLEGVAQAERRKNRRVLKDRTEAGEENEFATHHGASKLNLDDLLAPLATSSASIQSLKKSAKILTSKSTKNRTLSAPLPQRTQERLDREAAYDQTKGEVDKWNSTMQRIKEAEHLSFPLQVQPEGKVSNLELAAKFKPTTELESAVDKLLKSAKMREQDIAQTESLKMNHLSVEEVSARRAELAKMRELMFRAEAKAKRVAKIKSKTYRRLRKKEKQKLAAKLGEASDEEDELDEEGIMKREVQRARERATLRHKNAGKWAKAMKSRGELDEDQRRDIHEMLERGEKLRRRIRGEGSGDESAEDDDDDDEDSEGRADEDAISRIKASAFEELSALRREGEDTSPLPSSGGQKGKTIFEMKFMKDAMARDQQRASEMVDDFMTELGHDTDLNPGAGGEDAASSAEPNNPSASVAVERIGGRVSYRPGLPASSFTLRPVGSLASDTSSVTLKSSDLLPETTHPISPSSPETLLFPISERPPQPVSTSLILPTIIEAPNPWLVVNPSSVKSIQKKHEVAISKDSGSAEKSKNKLRKRVKNLEQEKEQARNDATVDISLSDVMTLGVPSASDALGRSEDRDNSARAKRADTGGPSNDIGPDDDSDLNSEVDEQERILDRKSKRKEKGGIKAFAQRDLVTQAFAGDNVVQEFAEAKRREIEEDAPREVDTTLPGWGSWGGAGTRKAPPKPHLIKKVAGVDPRTRADYGKAHIIISEKRDKKAAKYLVKDLPYPYTSKAQFERSMDTPIGTEWNTRVGFQRGTLPKVVTKMGTVIAPLEKLA